jgi:hypothetical protein
MTNINTFIKNEADEILYQKGLFNLLSSFGTPHISGSYDLNLMTWRDLDIYLEVENISLPDFFVLGSRINESFNPVKMSFRNELISKTPNLPEGVYWGVYLGNEKAGAWKIDIWAVNSKECQRLINYCTAIKDKLSNEFVARILDIKSLCWMDKEYRKTYSSLDIYEAVIENNIQEINGFKKYLELK